MSGDSNTSVEVDKEPTKKRKRPLWKDPGFAVSSTHIKLKIKDLDGNEIPITTRKSTQLMKFMTAFCDCNSLDINDMLFVYDGHQLQGSQTPEELYMEDGDQIHAINCLPPHGAIISDYTPPADITLKVKRQDDIDFFLTTRRSYQLMKLMTAFCDRCSMDFESMIFVFKGKRLRGDQTPEELKMKTGDEVNATWFSPPLYQPWTDITIQFKGEFGIEFFFTTQRSTQLMKLMTAFCDRYSVNFGSTLFLLNEFKSQCKVRGDQTLQELGLKSGDVIYAMKCTPQYHPLFDINLKVKGQAGIEVFFTIERSTRLMEVMTSFCDRLLVDFDTLLFSFDGRKIRGDQTPKELKIQNGDEISAILCFPPRTPQFPSDKITLKVKAMDCSEQVFVVKRSAQLKKLREAYCYRLSLHSDNLALIFEGRRLGCDLSDRTLEELGLKDGDVIDCMVRLTGGGGGMMDRGNGFNSSRDLDDHLSSQSKSITEREVDSKE